MLPSATRDVHIESTEPLITPIDLVNKLPITPQIERTVISGRDQVRSILNGQDKRLMMIVGPCSIHNEEAALEYAQRLVDFSKKLSDRLLILMRVYFEKPRTTIGWKGYIYDPHLDGTLDIETGLHRARALLLKIGEIGMYAGTEFLDPVVPQYLAGLVTWSTIGARTTESQIHRQMASGLSMPVGFKNGTDGNAQIAVDAMVSARSPHGFLGLDHQGRTA
jgi:3-deoxy-7-phosphoheptulonate synthase